MAAKPLDLEPGRAIVLEDNADPREDAFKDGEKKPTADETLVSWVVTRTDEWRTHRKTNFDSSWDRFERLWRGMWSSEEKIRGSERSKFVSPALSEAVEVSVSEIEEAVFGRGDFFDFKAEQNDPEPFKRALDRNKVTLREDLGETDFVTNVSDCLINAAVFGTGIGEIFVKTEVRREIFPTLAADGTPEADVEEIDVDYACLRAVNPRNFLIQPDARNIKEALGVAIEEDVGLHIIQEGQADGSYNDVEVEAATVEEELGADPQNEQKTSTADTAHIIRYYGLVPKRLLFPPEKTVDLDIADPVETENVTVSSEEVMVEAMVVIANKKTLLKAVENPSLMKDRPVVAFQWDSVPGRFWGRGICEKGEMPQRLLDTELRARIDALAFTGAPMMGIDSSRLPRGFKFEVAPGKSILTNGDPAQVLKPFQFGQVDQNTWQQGQMLDQMVQRSTGAMNTTQMAQSGASGDARTGAVSMSLAGVVKRMKRSLMRFTDQFFIPALKKILWRNMQHAPQRYIPMNSTFTASTTMGIMQREYEMLQLTQLLQAVQPGTPAHSAILKGVIAHTGLNNRREIMDLLDKAAQLPAGPPPVDQMTLQLEQAAKQLQLAKMQAEIEELRARAQASQAKAALDVAKAQDIPVDNQLEAQAISMKGIYNTPEEQMSQALVERGKMADRMLKGMELREKAAERISNERIVAMQTAADQRTAQLNALSTVADAAAQAHVVDNTPAPVVAPEAPIEGA